MTESADSASPFIPESSAALAEFLRAQTDKSAPLVLHGGKTDLHIGHPPRADSVMVDMTKLNRVIDYPARDMTITVEAGLNVQQLNQVLRENHQQLPIDVRAPECATVGGIVAANANGPRRFGYGTLRDYVIGVSAIDGTGRAFKAGGRVVKNVAGYDLCKLLTGSFGTLAAITQLTFKLKPIPLQTGILWTALPGFDEADRILERLVTSSARPVIVDVLSHEYARSVAEVVDGDFPVGNVALLLGVEGTSKDIEWQFEAMESELRAFELDDSSRMNHNQTQAIIHELSNVTAPNKSPLLFRASLRPSALQAFQKQCLENEIHTASHAANGIVYGTLPCETSAAKQASTLLAPLQAACRSAGGDLVILDCDDHWKTGLELHGQQSDTRVLMTQLKQAFDPHNVLSPGRML